MGWETVVSLASGIISLMLAIFAIWYATQAQKDSKDNFQKTQDELDKIREKVDLTLTSIREKIDKSLAENYDKTQGVLSNIETKASVIEQNVTDSQAKLMEMMTKIVDESMKKPDPKDQLQNQFIQQLMSDPKSMKPLLEMAKQFKDF